MKQVIAGLALLLLVSAAPVAAAAEAAESAQAAAELTARYRRSCAVCHDQGIAGAPKTGSKEAWAPKLVKGMDALVQSIENGLNAMPPKGMCFDCSAEDYKALIEYMAAETE